MTRDPHSDSGSATPGLEREHQSARDVRAKRLTLFILIAGVVSTIYALHDTVRQAYWTAAVHGIVALCQAVARYQQVKRNNLDLAGHWLLISQYISLGVTPLFDGNIRSPGLWCIVVLPVAASLLFGQRAVTRYTIGAVAVIVGHYLASPFITTERLITREPEQWAMMRVALLFVFAGMSLASGTASRRVRKQIAQRTQEMEQEAQDANVAERSKSTILATMSHEIRMPMQGLLSLIREGKTVQERGPQDQQLGQMATHASRVLRLLDALHDLVSLQSGQAELRENNFVLGALLERVHQRHEAAARAKGISLRTRMAVGPSTFVGDARRIYKLVSALVNNAVKFSEGGEIEICAELRAEPSGLTQLRRTVLISVRDQGIGMNPEQLSRVFGRFEQVHEDLDAQRGSWGLGLAIADQLARSMQGTLEATSEPGRGSTFTLTLPLQQDELFSTSWSECLAIQDLPVGSASKGASDQKSSGSLRNLVAVTVPMVLVCAATELSIGRYMQAGLHSACVAAMAWSGLQGAGDGKNWRGLVFLCALTLSMTSQAFVDGTIQSEALWTIGLVPVMTAFLFNVKAAFVLMGLTLSLLAHLFFSPKIPFQETYLGHGVFATVVMRLASLCAYAGTSFAISKSNLATMTAMRRQQRSMERIRENAVSSNEERARFLTRIRDELGAPLRHIVEESRTASKSPHLRTQLDTIHRCAGQIQQLFNRTLDYASDEHPQARVPQPAPFDLAALLIDTCRMFNPAATQKDRCLQFVNECDHTWVQGNASGVFEVVAVLLTHAIRTGEPGPVYLCLTQTKDSDPELTSFEIKVRCAGLRVGPEQRSLIASQGHEQELLTCMQDLEHNSILRGLLAAKSCGGDIRLAPQPGSEQGLVFRVRLPRVAGVSREQVA